MDVILCRNVLLYFNADACASVLRRLVETLAPGGILIVGPCDPGVEVLEEDVERLERREAGFVRRVDVERSQPLESARVQVPAPEPSASDEPASRASTRAHVERSADSTSVVRWLEQALASIESGDEMAALESARRAYFLGPSSPSAVGLFGLLLARSGEHARAFVMLDEALVSEASDEDVDAFTAYTIRALVEAEWEAIRAA